MNPGWASAAFLVTATLFPGPALAFHSGLMDARGECIFTPAFIQDYRTAQTQVTKQQSARPLLALLKKYKRPEEQAELKLSIALTYNQHTGVVDPARAVTHFNRALQFHLPEKTNIQVYLWRGNSNEQLKKYPEALRDYLRGLLACSRWDLSGGWPKIASSKVPLSMRSRDPKNLQRIQDYRRYRWALDLKRFLLGQRYHLIDSIKQMKAADFIHEREIKGIMEDLTPNSREQARLLTLLKKENKWPWP